MHYWPILEEFKLLHLSCNVVHHNHVFTLGAGLKCTFKSGESSPYLAIPMPIYANVMTYVVYDVKKLLQTTGSIF